MKRDQFLRELRKAAEERGLPFTVFTDRGKVRIIGFIWVNGRAPSNLES
ncbi:hypothetical protein [Rhizobium sp. CC-YZS058]|nr:hypothetical protein [Rhizobium sp. CC-YZS058]MEA3536507.1 hypothetical protein [Rhizobium sp. CC-YZS058]